jgi:hypothetical protein
VSALLDLLEAKLLFQTLEHASWTNADWNPKGSKATPQGVLSYLRESRIGPLSQQSLDGSFIMVRLGSIHTGEGQLDQSQGDTRPSLLLLPINYSNITTATLTSLIVLIIISKVCMISLERKVNGS